MNGETLVVSSPVEPRLPIREHILLERRFSLELELDKRLSDLNLFFEFTGS